MIRTFSLLIICLLHSNFLFSTSNSSLVEAREAYADDRLEQSVVYASDAIERGTLKYDHLAEAYMLRGRSYLEMLNQMTKNGQASMLEIKRGLSIKCYADFNEASKLHPKVKKEVDGLLDDLYVHLLQEGFTLLGSVEDNPYNPQNDLLAESSLQYFDAAAAIHSDDYLVYKYRAMAYDELGDAEKSLAQMIISSDKVLHVPPSGYPDFDMFNILIETGEAMNKSQSGQLNEALDLLSETQKLLEDEKDAFTQLGKKFDQDEAEIIEGKFKEMADRLELQSYKLKLSSPKHHEATVNEIVSHKQNPKTTKDNLLMYGRLLKESAPREAMGLYRKAIEMDAEYGKAHQEAGDLIYHRAVSISKEISTERDYFRLERLQREHEAVLEMSIPYLKKALELDPNNAYVSATLKEVYFQLDMMPQYYALDNR